MAKSKAKSVRARLLYTSLLTTRVFHYRTIIVRLVSTAQTGYFYSTMRPRVGPRLSAVKYDPMGASPSSSHLRLLTRCMK
jgi:ribosomal protein L33